jgi:hypothetical protein
VDPEICKTSKGIQCPHRFLHLSHKRKGEHGPAEGLRCTMDFVLRFTQTRW